jgi:hypothetical protein
MKNSVLIAAMLVFIMSCGQKQENNKTTDTQPTREALKLDTICDGRIYESECIDRVEKHILEEHSEWASREGKTLHLSIEEGEDLSFTSNDDPSPENFVNYRLTNYFPTIDAYMVHVAFYEGGTNKIINRISGKMIETDGEILVSPDNTKFLAYNQDLATTYSFNGFEIYTIGENRYEQQYQKGLDWGPAEPKWLSNTKIEFVKISPLDFEPDGKAVYTLVNGKWVAE